MKKVVVLYVSYLSNILAHISVAKATRCIIWIVHDKFFEVFGSGLRSQRVTVGVARQRTLTTLWPWVPSTCHNLQPFTGNGDVSIWVKNIRVGRKNQTNKTFSVRLRQSHSGHRPSRFLALHWYSSCVHSLSLKVSVWLRQDGFLQLLRANHKRNIS